MTRTHKTTTTSEHNRSGARFIPARPRRQSRVVTASRLLALVDGGRPSASAWRPSAKSSVWNSAPNCSLSLTGAGDRLLGDPTADGLGRAADGVLDAAATVGGGYWYHRQRQAPAPQARDPAFDELIDRLAALTGVTSPSSPGTRDRVRLVRAGPGRHRHGHRGQRIAARAPELEMRAHWNGDAGTGPQGNRLLLPGLPPPHLTLPAQDVPDLIDGPVSHGPGRPPSPQLEVRHPTSGEPQQDPHIRAVRRDSIGSIRQLPGFKNLVHGLDATPSVVVSRVSYARTKDSQHWEPCD